MIIRSFLFFTLLISLVSCVENFQPQLDESDTLLVVDGTITNMEGPYTVKLSISSGLDIQAVTPASNAMVTLVEEDGPSEILTEYEPGIYRTKAGGMKGLTGKRYKLLVNYDGRKYESEFQLLKAPTSISSVEAILEYKATAESPEEVPGIQFYVNTASSPYEDDYYLWTLNGTYKYHASLLIYYVYEGALREFNDHDSLNTCYHTYDIGGLYTAKTGNLTEPRITGKPMYFLPATDSKLSVRYSLLTTQYSISKEAYDFWHAVEQQVAHGGSLYTTQPYQIRGNVKNIDNPDEAVLGYFMVAGVTQNRLFVNTPPEVKIELQDCVPDVMALIAIFDSGPDEWPIYLPGGDNVPLGYVDPSCVDCQRLGGVLEPPSFWED